MREVLVLSYFFPPCNYTASNRIAAWAEHFYSQGLKPTFITRHWSENLASTEDIYSASGDKIEIRDEGKYIVHQLPFRPIGAERLLKKRNHPFFKIIYLVLRFFEEFLELITLRFKSDYNIFEYTRSLLKENSYELLMTSVNPWHHLMYLKLLSKESGIPWMADYRDDWTSNEIRNDSFVRKLIRPIEVFKERRSTSTLAFFTTATESFRQKICHTIDKPGHLIYNGYIASEFEENPRSSIAKNSTIEFTYIGAVYPSQNFKPIFGIIKEVMEKQEKKDFKITFVGINKDESQRKKIEKEADDLIAKVSFTDRLDRTAIIQYYKDSDVLFLTNYKEQKGTLPSKVFEYLASRKPILFYPSDHGELEEVLSHSRLSIMSSDAEQVKKELGEVISSRTMDKEELGNISEFTRQHQTEKLAHLINAFLA